MLKSWKEKNPDIKLFCVTDPEFAPYGNVLDLDTQELMDAASKIPFPESGSAYTPSVDSLEQCKVKSEIEERFFASLESQIGYCYGYNSLLNALEWHMGSEINVAVSDFVLFLALQSDLTDCKMDSSSVVAFFVPKGTAVEIYPSVLHFCPCETSAEGFGCIVALLKGTNIPHEKPVSNKLLFKKNKYLIAHYENTALIEKGIVPGISGPNLRFHY